jgi:membrane protein DedA with SNARE-associated domain
MDIFSHSSYFVITLVLILSGSGLPVPEEVPIIAAGLLAAGGSLNPWAAFACCLFGALVGDAVMYWIGYHFGRGVLQDHPRWARWVTPEREDRIEAMFAKHGLKVFFVARFLVGLRSPVYLTAGILRVSFRRFFLIDLICATAVVGTFFGVTYTFGQNSDKILRLIRDAQVMLSICVAIALACVAFYLWRRWKRKKAAMLKSAPKLPPAQPVPADPPADKTEK